MKILPIILVLSFWTHTTLTTQVQEIGTVELRNRMKSEKIVPVDIRAETEFRRLHIWGAVNLPPERVNEIAQLLPKDKTLPMVFYSLGSPDSLVYSTAQIADKNLGYREVIIYQDGFKQWRWHGYFLSGEGLNDYLTRRKDKPRDKTDRPEDVLNALKITSGSSVADIGAGWGYFTLHIANRVGEKGIVYAVEIVDAYVEQLRERIKQVELSNVHIIRGDVDNPYLPENKFDSVLLFDTYHEMTHPDEMLRHIRMGLKKEGRLVIVDYEPAKIDGRRETFTNQHTIPADTIVVEVEKVGLTLNDRIEEFIKGHNRGVMYLLVFEK